MHYQRGLVAGLCGEMNPHVTAHPIHGTGMHLQPRIGCTSTMHLHLTYKQGTDCVTTCHADDEPDKIHQVVRWIGLHEPGAACSN